ncbi:MAG: MarR family transcriptional regulator [Candidatus Saccharimonadales bacterium]
MNLPTYITSTVQTQAYRLLREHIYAVLSQYDLTPTYWSTLGIIFEARDGVRQVDIAQELYVKAPLVTTMARELERRGLVQSVQNQFDARAKLLALTPAGKKLMKNVEADLEARLKKLLNGLTERDLVAYHKVLTTIVSNDTLLKKQM